jgi:hypothetical protein
LGTKYSDCEYFSASLVALLLLYMPLRKRSLCTVSTVAVTPLNHRNIRPGCVSKIIFKNVDDVIINHEMVEPVIGADGVASTELSINVVG